MRVAVPASGSPGLEKAIHAHVATAPVFVIVDIDSGETVEIKNARREKENGELNPVGIVRDLKVDVLICAGMGEWAVKLIEAGGVQVYLAHGGTVKKAIEDFKAGRLKKLGTVTYFQKENR